MLGEGPVGDGVSEVFRIADGARHIDPQGRMVTADGVWAYGFPMKIRVPTKLGFKNPKYVMSMEVTNDYKGGYWEDQGYNSFSGS